MTKPSKTQRYIHRFATLEGAWKVAHGSVIRSVRLTLRHIIATRGIPPFGGK